MIRRRSAVLLVVLAGLVCRLTGQSPASAGFVPIPVAVTTADGTPVAGLTKDDFSVSSGKTPRAIERFAAPPAPLSLIVLFDVSASMVAYGDLRDEIARSIAPALQPGDRFGVGGIARRVVLPPALTASRQALIADGRKAVSFSDEDRTGPSPVWDAVDAAIVMLERESARRAILLVTDGEATGNHIGPSAVLTHALRAGVLVQVLTDSRPMILPQGGNVAAAVRPGAILQQIATATGGLLLPEQPVPSGETFPKAGPLLVRLVNDLRGMYTLGIAAGADAGLQPLQVRVGRPGLTVRVRAAYDAPGRPPA